jgi:hypothetical protein
MLPSDSPCSLSECTFRGRPVSFLKDMADDADENYVVYVLKPLAGASVRARAPGRAHRQGGG